MLVSNALFTQNEIFSCFLSVGVWNTFQTRHLSHNDNKNLVNHVCHYSKANLSHDFTEVKFIFMAAGDMTGEKCIEAGGWSQSCEHKRGHCSYFSFFCGFFSGQTDRFAA